MSESELKPCPFCGSPAEELYEPGEENDYALIRCTNFKRCIACSLPFTCNGIKLLRKLWNARTRPSGPDSADGWIYTKDRLPEDLSESYLIYSEYEGDYAYGVWVGDYVKDIESWFDAGGDKVHPTHWMPLPPPPSESRDKGGDG